MRWGPDDLFEQTCTLCSPDPDETDEEIAERRQRRARWGCDGPCDPSLRYRIDCVRCPPTRPRKQCRECHGTGYIEYDRCPFQVVPDDVWDICTSADLLQNSILPGEGGFADQAAKWLDAVTFVLREKAQWDERKRETARRKAEAEAKRKNPGAGRRRSRR